MKRFSFFVLWLLSTLTLSAQHQKELDSLWALLPKVTDTTEVNVLYAIARLEFDRDAEKALRVSKQSLAKAKVLDFLNGQVMAYKQVGVFYNYHRNQLDTSKFYLDSALALARTPAQRVSVYTALGTLHAQKGEFVVGERYLLQALELISDKNSRAAYNTYNNLAYCMGMMERHRQAARYFKRALAIADHQKNPRDIGAVLANLGLAYVDLQEYDSALTVYRRLYKFELVHGNPLNNATLLSELGRLYFEKDKIDSAFFFMHAGLRAANKVQMSYAIGRSLSNLGHYHVRKHNADSALYYGRKLWRHASRKSKLEMEDVSDLLSRAFRLRKQVDSAFFYADLYKAYHDSAFQERTSKQIAELETQFELRHKEDEIKRLASAHQNEVLKRNALAGGLALTVLVGVLGFFVLRGRIRARKKEIELQLWQLDNFARKMVEKSELVEELRVQLEQFKSQITIPNERIEMMSQIVQFTILTDDDWEEFKRLFTKVNPYFFADLKVKYPDLTQAEIRLAALLKLNMSTREIANVLGISMDSANKARYRLRKKLDLPPEKELKDFIDTVSKP